jgi:regulatory protein
MENRITGFKKEGRRAPKIVVFLNEEPWQTLDPETVVRERLRTGEDLSAARQREILATDEAIRARKAAAGFAARTPKTRRELEHYLRGKRFSVRAIQAALETLSASGTVDDERVAGQIVHSRRRRRDVGPKRLEAELISRGVAPRTAGEHIDQALKGADLAAECLELARHFLRRYEPLDQPAQRQKLANFLLRRGYEAAQVWPAIRQICAERQIADDE